MAAKHLDQILHNAAMLGRPLLWLDARETGMPKVKPDAAEAVVPALLALANHFDSCLAAHRNGQHILRQELWSKWSSLDPKRLDFIGFVEEQMAMVLDEAQVGHSLVRPDAAESDADAASSDVASLKSIGHQVHRLDDALTNFDDLYNLAVEQILSWFVPGEKGARSRLRDAVWTVLKEAAEKEDSERLPFLVGYTPALPSKAPKIKYEGATGGTRTITKASLATRLTRGNVLERSEMASPPKRRSKTT